MTDYNHKSGFTLSFTMILFLIIGILSLTFYNMVKSEKIESFHNYKKIQNSLEIESAINYTFFKMKDSFDTLFRTENIKYTTQNNVISFELSHVQNAAFSVLKALTNDSSKTFVAKTGFIKNNLPALMLFSSNANVSLVENAKIKGGIALKNGTIKYSDHYKFHATKEAFYDSAFVGDSLPYFDTLKIRTEYSKNQFKNTFENESCIFDGKDKVNDSINCTNIIFQGDSYCNHCQIESDKIIIRERAILKNANIKSRTIQLKENPELSGTFFAQESLYVNLNKPQENSLNLIVQGIKKNSYSYDGKLIIDKLNANHILIAFLGDSWSEIETGIPVTISNNTKLKGLVFCNGIIDFRGELIGNLIAFNVGFEENSLWRGFFRDGKITTDTNLKILLPDVIYLGGYPSYEIQ